MTSSFLTLALSASLLIGQSGDGPKPVVKTAAMEKLEKTAGAAIVLNDPIPGRVSISVSGPKATDAVMEEIAKIKFLDEVLVGSGAITDKGVAALAKRKSITRLFLLKNTKLTAACVKDIVSMPNLNVVQLSQFDLDAAAVKALADKGTLRSLLLNTMGVTDADLAAFVGNKNLKALNLAANDGIKGKGLTNLHGMKQLTFIDLVGTHASKAQIADLKDAITKAGGKVEIRGKGSIGGVAKIKPPASSSP